MTYIPAILSPISRLEQALETTVDGLITLAAIVAGVAAYAITALQLWWEDNGASVKAVCVRSYEGARAAWPVVRYEAGELVKDTRAGWTVVKVATGPVLRRLQAL